EALAFGQRQPGDVAAVERQQVEQVVVDASPARARTFWIAEAEPALQARKARLGALERDHLTVGDELAAGLHEQRVDELRVRAVQLLLRAREGPHRIAAAAG